jgi:hypothetical protein
MVARDRLTKALVAAAVLLFLGLGFVTVLRATKAYKQTDLTVYLAAADSVLRGGGDLYRVKNERGWHYLYLPLFAIAMVPFARLPLFWSSLLWYILSVGLAIWALRMCVAMAWGNSSRPPGPLAYALPICLVGWPLMSALTRGQASVLLLWLVVAAVYGRWKGRRSAASACLAGAVVLKIFPVLLLGYYAVRRDWRFVTATLVGIVLGVCVVPAAVLGWQQNSARLREWVALVANPALDVQAAPESDRYAELLDPQRSRNQSLPAVLFRLTGSPRMREVAMGMAVLMALAIGLAGWRAAAGDQWLVMSTVFPWILLVPPVSWNHYFVLLLPPLAALVFLALHGPEATTRRLSRIALVVFAPVNLIGKPLEYWGSLCWSTLFLWGILLAAAFRGRAEGGRSAKPWVPRRFGAEAT